MNYEEKLREIINSKYYHSEDKAVFAKYFPELKENEDERMRKEIIKFLRLPHRQFAGKRDHEKWIAWLEKQGEKSTIIDIDKMVMEYSQTKDSDFGLPVNCMIRAYRKGIEDALEKQGNNKECGEEWEVSTGLYKCTKRMFDGSPEGRLLFEVGNLYKCVKIHKCITNNNVAVFESPYWQPVFLTDSMVRKHFIKV